MGRNGAKIQSCIHSSQLHAVPKPWAEQGSLLPFLVEDQLRRNGAQAENKETLADKHTVVVDQRIVSSMFLPSAALVAEEMVRLLAREGP